MEETKLQYPLFLNAKAKIAWEKLNIQANDLLGLASEGADNYSNPIIDANGDYWFVVNPEVAELVDITKCVSYDSIILPQPKM